MITLTEDEGWEKYRTLRKEHSLKKIREKDEYGTIDSDELSWLGAVDELEFLLGIE
jgi:hypothetical protein